MIGMYVFFAIGCAAILIGVIGGLTAHIHTWVQIPDADVPLGGGPDHICTQCVKRTQFAMGASLGYEYGIPDFDLRAIENAFARARRRAEVGLPANPNRLPHGHEKCRHQLDSVI